MSFKAKSRMAHLKNRKQNEENLYNSWNFAADYEKIRGRNRKSRLGRRKIDETPSNTDFKSSGIPVHQSGFSIGKNSAQSNLKLNQQNVLNTPFNLYSYKQRSDGLKDIDKEIKLKNEMDKVEPEDKNISSMLNNSFINDKQTYSLLNALNESDDEPLVSFCDRTKVSPSSPVNEDFMTCVYEPLHMSKFQSSFCFKTPGKQLLTTRRSDDSPLDPLAGISDNEDENTVFTVKTAIKQDTSEKFLATPKSTEFFKPKLDAQHSRPNFQTDKSFNLSNEHKRDQIFTPSPYTFKHKPIHQDDKTTDTHKKDQTFTPSMYTFEKEQPIYQGHKKTLITPNADTRPKLDFLTSQTDFNNFKNDFESTINNFPSKKEQILTLSPFTFEKKPIQETTATPNSKNPNKFVLKSILNHSNLNEHKKDEIFTPSQYTFEKPIFQDNERTLITPQAEKANFKNDFKSENDPFKPNIINSFANMDIRKPEKSLPPKSILTPPYTKIMGTERSNFAQKDFPFQPISFHKKTREEENVLYVNKKPYIVLTILGKGGSSQVYKVLDEQHKTVAVKCVNLDNVEDVIANGYLNEIKLLAELQDCKTVIRMYDYEFVHETKKLNVVMEIGEIDFSKLLKNVDETKNISVAMIVYYWSEMLASVQEIHERGIIHSDLKPANFLVVKGRLKLIDFGISSSLQGDMTSVFKEITTGTYNYMSPEAISYSGEIAGYKITYKSDIWSLGCILYNLLYGQTPFSHIKNTWAKLRAIADPRFKIVFPDDQKTPIHLIIAMRLCFVRDPKLRPSASELIQILELPTSNSSLTRQIDNLIFEELKYTFPNLSGEITQLENEIKGKKC